jgi:hypothetical protein
MAIQNRSRDNKFYIFHVIDFVTMYRFFNIGVVRMNKSRMLACIVLQCGYHYLSMFLTISQPPGISVVFQVMIFYSVGSSLYI